MKISNYIYTGSAKPYGKNNFKDKNSSSVGFSQLLDTVEISSDGNNYLEKDDDVRINKVNSIKERIDSGRYIFDANAAARNMLASYLH